MTFRSRIYTTGALGAVVSGLSRAVRAPLLLAAIYLASVAAVVPFAIVLGSRLQEALASQRVTHDPAHDIDANIDAEWWFEFIRHARGLESTFTPAIVGAAAPLSSASAVLDGQVPPAALWLPVALFAVLWAWLWGGVIERLRQGRALGLRAFAAACSTCFSRFLALAIVAAVAYVLLYATVHAALFGPVWRAVGADAIPESRALLWRVALYLVFAGCLLVVNVFVDYTRAFVVIDRTSLAASFAAARRFILSRPTSVLAAHVLVSLLFVAGLAAYVVVDAYGGARVGGWRAVIIGQVFVVGRLAVRMVFAAAAVAMIVGRPSADHRSNDEAKPGPPAAT
jgi:hypothetical protein